MQCKDIPDGPVLEFLGRLIPPKTATWFDIQPRETRGMAAVIDAMPTGTPEKLCLAKMRMLIRRGLVMGCGCGCRGEFYLSDKGRQYLEQE